MPAQKMWFEPSEYSVEELQFLLTSVDQPPSVIRTEKLPPGCVRAQVLKLVTQCYELAELDRHKSVPWCGYPVVKHRIERYLAWMRTCQELQRRGGPAHPSHAAWDGNRFLPRGIGSDSDITRTEILKDGTRQPFGVLLNAPDGTAVGPALIGAAPWLEPGPDVHADLYASVPHDCTIEENPKTRTGLVTCPICGFAQNYDLAKHNSKQLAIARVRSHAKRAKTQVDQHRILFSRMTGQSVAV